MNDTMENGTDSSISFTLPPASSIITDLAFNLILVLPSNIYVLWLILSGACGTIASEFFYLNLTASVIISILEPILWLSILYTDKYTLSMAANFIFFVFFLLSVPSFQCCICVERYLAVVHPVVYLRYKVLRYRVACCCVVWLMVIVLSLICFWSLTVQCFIVLAFDFVCISVLSFCCLSVLRALRQPGPGEGQKDSGNDMKKKAFKIILISLIVMVATVMMLIPYILSLGLLTTELCNPVALLITFHLSRVSGLVHPLIYIHKVGKLPCFN